MSAESTQATLCEAWYEELYGIALSGRDAAGEIWQESRSRVRGTWPTPPRSSPRDTATGACLGEACFAFSADPTWSTCSSFRSTTDCRACPAWALPGRWASCSRNTARRRSEFRSCVDLKKRYGLVGASYIAVYEFGPKIRGASALNFGESGDPASPHFFDQAQLLSDRKLKPELFDWSDVLAGAKLVYHPGEPPLPPRAGSSAVDRVGKNAFRSRCRNPRPPRIQREANVSGAIAGHAFFSRLSRLGGNCLLGFGRRGRRIAFSCAGGAHLAGPTGESSSSKPLPRQFQRASRRSRAE